MNKYAVKLSGKYNRLHAGQFGRKGAARKFLGPWGLHLSKAPPARFGNNTDLLTKQSEFRLFCSLHFMRYKITKSQSRRNLNRYLLVYLSLRNRAISANWKLVPSAVSRMSRGFYDLDALTVESNRGLIDAADKFDPWRGYKFSTYACNAIHRRIWREIGRKKMVGMTSSELVPENATKMEDQNEALWLEQLTLLLSKGNNLDLNTQERDVLYFRFHKGLTLNKSGAEMGISGERTRQIQVKLIQKIRTALDHISVLNEDAIQYGILKKPLGCFSS